MSGKIKEYVNKKFFTLLTEIRPAQDDAASEGKNKESHAARYLKTRHPVKRDGRIINQSRNRQQNVPYSTIIQLHPSAGLTGAGNPGKRSGY